MAEPSAKRWKFTRSFRAGCLRRGAGERARQVIRDAITEITTTGRTDRLAAAEGALQWLARVVPALAGEAATPATTELLAPAVTRCTSLLATAPADAAARRRWLDTLFRSCGPELCGCLAAVAERWPELCAGEEVAAAWLARTLPEPCPATLDPGTLACAAGALVAAGRPSDALAQLDRHPEPPWPAACHGVRALRALGRPDDALRLAEAFWQRGAHDGAICEEILLELGRPDEALAEYAVTANQRGSAAATFRALATRYPDRPASEILERMLMHDGDPRGEWLAVAIDNAEPAAVAELVERQPFQPTSAEALGDQIEARDPNAARRIALQALHWASHGHGDARGATATALLERALRLAAHESCLPQTIAAARAILAGDGIMAPQLARAVAEPLAVWEVRQLALEEGPPVLRQAPPGNEASQVLLAFAEPVLATLAGDRGAPDAIQIALAAWNCDVFEAWGSPAAHVETARQRLRDDADQALFGRLLARKRRRFGHHQWAVGPCVLRRNERGAWEIETEVLTLDDLSS